MLPVTLILLAIIPLLNDPLPMTCSLDVGEFVPIPTFCPEETTIAAEPHGPPYSYLLEPALYAAMISSLLPIGFVANNPISSSISIIFICAEPFAESYRNPAAESVDRGEIINCDASVFHVGTLLARPLPIITGILFT